MRGRRAPGGGVPPSQLPRAHASCQGGAGASASVPTASVVPWRQPARIRPRSRRALATMARCLPRVAALLSPLSGRPWSWGRARRAAAPRHRRPRLAPCRRREPRRTACPDADALGGSPVARPSARAGAKRVRAPGSVAQVRATPSPRPGTRRDTVARAACAAACSRSRRRLSRRWRVAQRHGSTNTGRRTWRSGGSDQAAISRPDR